MKMKTPLFLFLSLVLVLGSGMLLVFTGCNPTKSDSSTVAPPISEAESSSHDHMDDDHADHDSDSAGKSDMEKMAETLANFQEEDRQSAMKQHFCPVSGEMLGTMGKPEKVEVDGQSVWICCDGCKDKLLADPEMYLAKLNK